MSAPQRPYRSQRTLLARQGVTRASSENGERLFAGGGEMGAIMRSMDWAQTPLGPVAGWSASLRTTVTLLLANRFPMLLWWGPQHCQLYNDAYRPVLGTKHPRSMGQPAPECWTEIWDIIGPMVTTPYEGGPPTWNEDLFLEVNRHGFMEETHFTVAYSPVPDPSVDSGIGGVLATVHEITRQVIQERRVAALRDLGTHAAEAKTVEEACRLAADAFARHPQDVPFALLYLIDAERDEARLAGIAGAEPTPGTAPAVVQLGSDRSDSWPLASVYRSEMAEVVVDIGRWCDPTPPGPWSDPPRCAMVLPIRSNVQHRLAGLLVLGISPRVEFDELYRSFFELATTPVATAIANARAFDEERRRAESLAELDRAKTAFFSNVSHEFRTPLTLILGPLSDALAESDSTPGSQAHERLTLAHRNGMRLLKLVNTLLDFSRIEAGRVQASYQATDLGSFTSEVAGAFRSAMEGAGLAYVVTCPDPAQPVFVDREMWEKVVLNLISNAFKFTLAGRVEVSLRERDGMAELAVTDTGCGIPAEELAHVFERFHRVEGTRGRTYEGTGIGLALVQELVKLHGGTVSVESTQGHGSTFRVCVPTGCAHLPAERVEGERTQTSTALGATPFVEEALRWLPAKSDSDTDARANGPSTDAKRTYDARVVLIDDNADMREYVERLLSDQFRVEPFADGVTGLRAVVERPPDLILSDVMMPGLDGFELLRAVRSDARTRDVPVILLTARAGEESRVEGLDAGADDYLVKPFSARELVARVSSHVALSLARRESADARAHELERENRMKDEFLAMLGHELRNPLSAIRNALETASVDGPMRPRALAIARRQSDQLRRLVDDLLDVARITHGQILLQKERVRLMDILDRAIDSTRVAYDSREVTLTVVRDDTIDVDVDSARIEQVLGNLLTNAAKYSESGGAVDAEVSRAGDEAIVRVRDRGVGISPEMLPRVFDLFMQADRHVDRTQGGLGIGLTVARRLLELHGGRIEAHSGGLGQGAEFVVRLPLLPASDADVRVPAARASIARATAEVLLVEDNQDAAETFLMVLEALGHRVRVAHDGMEALDAARSMAPDLMLVDVGLPGMNGYEVARRVRRESSLQSLVLVAITGYGRDEDRQEALAAGFDHHFVKPVDLEALAEVMARSVRHAGTGEPATAD